MEKMTALAVSLARKVKSNYQLCLILLLSSILNLFNLKIEQYANKYYAAGVKSMTMNLKNFFFVSFDPAGFISIDKPPVGFWIQALSAKLFGFSGWSIILPQAIAGIISVWLLYYTVNRTFGKVSGIISALCLSITPIFVAASRNNTIDNILVLTSIGACLFVSIAAERGSLKYLLLSIILIGIGFNIKMLQAYMILPAVYLTYFISSTILMKKKIQHLIFGTIILVAVSLSWAVVVDLTPAQNRPNVGSSSNNTIMDLIVGHNGEERLNFGTSNQQTDEENDLNDNSEIQDKGNSSTPKITSNGSASIIRLFSENNLSDQISWVLPLALLGFIVSVLSEKWKDKTDKRRKLDLVLWGMCLIPEYIYFSFIKGIAHSYYLTMMAPSISALVGIGIMNMWRIYNKGGAKAIILPAVLIVNVAVELHILSYYSSYSITKKIMLLTGIVSLVSLLVLIILIFRRDGEGKLGKEKIYILSKALLMVAFIGILIAPSCWSFITMFYKLPGGSPIAGLRLVNNKNHEINIKDWFKPVSDENIITEKLIKFLDAHGASEKYLITGEKANDVSDFIIRTGKSAMAFGGYSGKDDILTLDQFKEMVKNREVKYVLLEKDENENEEIDNWIRKNGKIFDLNNEDGTKEDKAFEAIYELG